MPAPLQEFHHLVYALSYIRHLKEQPPAPATIAKISPRDRKYLHLSLLDDIALLLVTGGKGDMAAVMMKQNPQSIEFFYAKNEPCESSLDVYLGAIQRALIGTKGFLHMQYELLAEVMFACSDKFKSRVAKCKKELEACGNITLPTSGDQRRKTFSAYLKEWADLSDEEVITSFSTELRDFDASIPARKSAVQKSIILSQKAWMIGLNDRLDPYPTFKKRVQKLGAYFGAAVRIKRLMMRPDYFKLRDKIKFREVRAPKQKSIEVPRNIVDILNENARKNNDEEITLEDLVAKFPLLNFSKTGSEQVTLSCHCELTVALHALNLFHAPKVVEIGVSKGLCWLSQRYVENFFTHTPLRILVSQNQGKIHSGWVIPPGTPKATDSAMRQLIEWEIRDIRRSVISRRNFIKERDSYSWDWLMRDSDFHLPSPPSPAVSDSAS